MRTLACFALVAALVAAAPLAADGPLISSPGFAPTQVDVSGVIHESWGAVSLSIVAPEGARKVKGTCEGRPFMRQTTTHVAGPIELVQTAYRAPIWPGGVDVLTARIENTSDAASQATVTLNLPDTVTCGDLVGVAGGRAVVALPKGVERVRREERPWGCTGGVVAMPGWARPQGECDPAFRSISAGMGGVPIVYRFAVPAGEKRQVILGFCESHWSAAGQRPVRIMVEGAPASEVDPIAAWGQHKPGCLAFAAHDANKDGRLEVTVAPLPRAPDKNPILNVIWVFAPEARVGLAEVVRGSLSASAERYVDVGGERDQLLYKPGPVSYAVALPPKGTQVLTFLLANRDCPAVPNPATTAWTPETLWKAAADVGEAHARP